MIEHVKYVAEQTPLGLTIDAWMGGFDDFFRAKLEEAIELAPILRQQQLDEFKRAARDPEGWLQKADSLYLAAKYLWQHEVENQPPTHAQTMLMLCSYALEALLKGIYCSGKEVIEGGQSELKLTRGLTTHKLDQLWKNSSAKTSPPNDEFLTRLFEAATIWGRYPVAKNSKSGGWSYSSEDWKTFEELFSKLKQELALVTEDHERRLRALEAKDSAA